ALPVEAALHHVPRAVGQRLPGDAVLFERLLRLGLVDELARRLHFHHVRAELAGDLRRVGGHVHRGLALLVGDAFAARIRPGHRRQAAGFRFLDERAQVFVLVIARRRAGIDGVADGHATEAYGIAYAAGHRALRRVTFRQSIRIVQLQDE